MSLESSNKLADINKIGVAVNSLSFGPVWVFEPRPRPTPALFAKNGFDGGATTMTVKRKKLLDDSGKKVMHPDSFAELSFIVPIMCLFTTPGSTACN